MNSALVQTYATYPFTLESGEGPYVFDTDGRRYLDLYGGHAVSILGHQPEAVVSAITAQANKLFFYSNVAPLGIREEAATRLVSFAGGGFSHVFFCNSGAEANEHALKLAMQLTGRSAIAALTGGFHGRTGVAAGATDNASWHSDFKDWIGPVHRLAVENFDQLDALGTDVAAIIAEPIQSMCGMVTLSEKYLQALRATCDRIGALLILDEVQTGVGRTGVPYVGSSVVQSDMSTSAKSLASGFPIGAILMTDTVASKVSLGQLGTTFGGNPLAMAALLATIDEIESNNLLAHAAEIGSYARETLLSIPGVTGIRGAGCLLGIELAKPAKEIVAAVRENGILIGTSGDPHVARILAPVIITKEHIDELAQVLRTVCQ